MFVDVGENDIFNSGIICVCRQCDKPFTLTADDDVAESKTHIMIKSCESGGIYATYIECPHCKYNHNLM